MVLTTLFARLRFVAEKQTWDRLRNGKKTGGGEAEGGEAEVE